MFSKALSEGRRLMGAGIPLAALLAGFALLPPVPLAAQETEDDVVLYACYVQGSGVTYRVNPPDSPGEDPKLPDECKSKNHTLFYWNQVGPPGPKGDRGPPGPPGSFECRPPNVHPAAAPHEETGGLGLSHVPFVPATVDVGESPTEATGALTMDPFIGQMMLVPFDFAPRGWMEADGRLLPIADNTALFSLIGAYYGGDGRTTFGLPDLRGLEPVCGMKWVIALVGIFPSRS